MTFNPRIWTPIARLLTAVNVAAVYFAAQATEPVHATAHGVLAVAALLWSERLRVRGLHALMESEEEELGALPGEMNDVRHELAEMQERLDFAERMLAQRREPDRSN
jgi:hypothetical protein